MMGDLSRIDQLACFLIIAVGLPHGALDGALAGLLGCRTKSMFLRFVTCYVTCSLVVIALWVYFPQISLLLFVIVSMVHFGRCDWVSYGRPENKRLIIFTHGMVAIFGIIFFNEKDSLNLFRILVGKPAIENVYLLIIPYLATIIALLIFCILSLRVKVIRRGVLEMLMVLICAYYFNPLAAFAVHFCFCHSYKHTKHVVTQIYRTFSNYRLLFLSGAIFTTITWLTGFFCFRYLSSSFTIYESMIKIIFIGLASLTIPHVILVDYFYPKFIFSNNFRINEL
tara:strand:- start:61 stop:906 length:846 start_codon:yes stop_codon:yes gene_type:complete